jgi:hypothetical protein
MCRYYLFVVAGANLIAPYLPAEEAKTPAKPKADGRPVYIISGRVVVFPEGIEEPPADYRGAIGARPIGILRINETIVAEIFASPLKGTASDEAKGMAASAGAGQPIDLVKQGRLKVKEESAEVVTLRMKLKSKLGSPWLVHSLYFPLDTGSTTFKLVTSEANFASVLPYFHAMLMVDEARPAK